MSFPRAIKLPCRCATTGNITLSGLQTVDGIALAEDDRVVVRAQADAVENGIYSASTVAWERTPDFDGRNDVVCGTLVHAYEGTTYKGWHEVTTALPQVGTSAITWRFWRWRASQQLGDGYAAGQSSAGMNGTIQVSGAMSATAVAAGDMVGLPNSAATTAGRATAVAVGALKWYAAGYSVGAATASAGSTPSGDVVYVWEGAGATYGAEKYYLTTHTIAVASSLTTSYPGQGWCACGNATAARLDGGTDLTTESEKYIYATEATSVGATLGIGAEYRSGCQSSTVGYFFGGRSSASPNTTITNVDKITFSTEVRSAGTALGTSRMQAGAAGNSSRAIIAGGAPDGFFPRISSTEKYTYSGDSRTAGTSLASGRATHGAAGNTTKGIFGGGDDGSSNLATTEKYTYSGDSRTSGGSLSAVRADVAAAGNNTTSLFSAGNDSIGSPISSTDKYTLSSDTSASGTALASVRYGHTSACTNQGGF